MTRGQRNNNPLNIRRSADHWQGARVEQTDRSFVQFESMAYGYRAAWKVLESYWNHFRQKRIIFNVENIICRWAPPTENDTKAYLRTVLTISGLGGKENLSQPSRGMNYERMECLIAAMTCVECGIPYKEVDKTAIREGFDLAFPGVRKERQRKLMPKNVADLSVHCLPDMKGTTFCTKPMDELLIWDEYRDW